jgi:hypothetical protein
MLKCSECLHDGRQPDCYSPIGNNECSNFSDLSVVEEQEQPEQYEIKNCKKGEVK